MNDVEICRFSGHGFEQCCLRSNRIRSRPPEAKRARPSRDKICACFRVPAGKQGYLVSKLDQFLNQPCDDPLGAAVKLGRDAFRQWCDLRNSHHRLPA
jgi:hypothetical protein